MFSDSSTTGHVEVAGASATARLVLFLALLVVPPLVALGSVALALLGPRDRQGEIAASYLFSVTGLALAAIAWVRQHRTMAMAFGVFWILFAAYSVWITMAFAQ